MTEEKKSNNLIGFKFKKKNTKNGILLEIWKENNNKEETDRRWIKIYSEIQNPKFWKTPPSDHQLHGHSF